MRQPPLIPPERPPRYGETKAEAYAKLKASGRDLVQDERVRLAIAYLAPCTRETLYDWLATPKVPGLMSMKPSSVSRSVNTLIHTGKVRAIGKAEGRYGSKVEVLDLGMDERIKKKKGRLLEQATLPDMEYEARRPAADWQSGYNEGFNNGLFTGLVAGGLVVALLWLIVELA